MNINTIYYNEDLTIKSQTTQPIRAFAEQANTIEVYAPVSAHNAGYFVVQGLKAGVPNPRLIPTERLLMYDVGDETVGGVLYHHYNAVIPGAALNDMSLMASTGIRFLAEFWYLGDTSLGVRFYDTEVPETIAGYLATDFPAAVSGDSVRVIDTDTDWDFDGADWTDFDSQHLVAVTKAPTDVADFTLQRGISTTDPTHAPTNTELILQEIRNSNVITAAMKPYMENVFAYVAAQTGAESMQFNVSTSETADAVGKVAWNNTEKTLDIMLTASSILHIGQATVVYVTNKTGSTIAKGVPVSVYGNSSDVGAALVAPVGNDVYATAMRLLGVTTESIANTASGFVCIAGEVTGLNLSSFAIGKTLYLSTAGVFTATKPTPSATVKAIVKIGEVLNHSATVGVLLVAPFAHCDINDASDVYLSGTPTNMSVLVYNSTDERWQNSTQANFLSDCAKLSAENEFTGISYYTSGLYAITVDTVHGAIKMYYAFHLYATLDKSGVYLNPSYITSVTDNFVPSKGMVDGYITTHDGSSVAHAAIRSSISDLETEIARLDGRGKSYGEIGYTTAELEAMSVGDRNTAINAAIVDGFGGAAYTPTTNDLCYDEGVGSGVRYHEWEYNGTNWVDNGEYTNAKATNDIFGIVKGNEYVTIIAGVMQVLLADNATNLKNSGSAAYYTYSDIYDAIARIDTAENDIAVIEAEQTTQNNRLTASEADITTLTNNIATLDDANLNESKSRFSPAIVGTIEKGDAEVTDSAHAFNLNEIHLDGLTARQLAKNGNFVTTDNWTSNGASFTAASNVGTFTADTQNDTLTQAIAFISGHVYFIHAQINVASADVSLFVNDGSTAFVTDSHSATTGYETLSAVGAAAASGSFNLTIKDARASAWTAILVKNVVVLDLTALGTHPSGTHWHDLTAEQIDAYIGDYQTTTQAIANAIAGGETNKVTNGTFDANTTGWVPAYSGNSWDAGGYAKNTGSGEAVAPVFYQNLSAVVALGDVVYLSFKIKVSNSLCTSLNVILGANTIGTISNPVINNWYNVSYVGAFTNNVVLYFTHNYANTTDATDAVCFFDDIILYDITDYVRTDGIHNFTPTAFIASNDSDTINNTDELIAIGELPSLPDGKKSEYDNVLIDGVRTGTLSERAAVSDQPNASGWTRDYTSGSHTSFHSSALSGYLPMPYEAIWDANTLTNWDFNSALSGSWTTNNVGTPTVAGSVVAFTATAQDGGIYQTFSPVDGHVYYATARIKTARAMAKLALIATNYFVVFHSGSGNYEKISFVGALSYAATTYFAISDGAASSWAQIEIDYAFYIDLTALGLDPEGVAYSTYTAAAIDALVPTLPNVYESFKAPLMKPADFQIIEAVEGNNILTNAKFNTDYTGWTATDCGTPTVTSGVLSFTATAQNGNILQAATTTSGHVHYVKALVNATSVNVKLVVDSTVIEAQTGEGAWEVLSGLFTSTAASHDVAVKDVSASGWATVYVDYISITDLTALGTAPNGTRYDAMSAATLDALSIEGITILEGVPNVRLANATADETSELYTHLQANPLKIVYPITLNQSAQACGYIEQVGNDLNLAEVSNTPALASDWSVKYIIDPMKRSFTTAERPANAVAGQTLYDSTLGKMILYNGSAWVNLDGTALS